MVIISLIVGDKYLLVLEWFSFKFTSLTKLNKLQMPILRFFCIHNWYFSPPDMSLYSNWENLLVLSNKLKINVSHYVLKVQSYVKRISANWINYWLIQGLMENPRVWYSSYFPKIKLETTCSEIGIYYEVKLNCGL